MAELTPTYDEQPIKAIIVTVDTGEFDAELSLGELEELAHTAGAEVVGSVLQKRPHISARAGLKSWCLR